VQPYIDRATKDNAKIKYVFETHFHADFVSGHLDLKAKTGAEIVFGPNGKPTYDAITATDGQIFEIGNYKIKVICQVINKLKFFKSKRLQDRAYFI
jgi:glyoxylase-like metal-dependent hydrolase (beta-lactamase superfamily II)